MDSPWLLSSCASGRGKAGCDRPAGFMMACAAAGWWWWWLNCWMYCMWPRWVGGWLYPLASSGDFSMRGESENKNVVWYIVMSVVWHGVNIQGGGANGNKSFLDYLYTTYVLSNNVEYVNLCRAVYTIYEIRGAYFCLYLPPPSRSRQCSKMTTHGLFEKTNRHMDAWRLNIIITHLTGRVLPRRAGCGWPRWKTFENEICIKTD